MAEKKYMVSLDIIASPSVSGSEIAGAFGIDESMLSCREIKRGVLWRFEPDVNENMLIDDRISHLSSLIHVQKPVKVSGEIESICLSIGVLYYDTVTCTVGIDSQCLDKIFKSLGMRITLEIACYPCSSHEEEC